MAPGEMIQALRNAGFLPTFTGENLVDKSGVIVAGGTSQQVLPANGGRKYVKFQNMDSVNMYINWGAVATTGAGSEVLVPGDYVEFYIGIIPVDSLFVLCSKTNAVFTCKEV